MKTLLVVDAYNTFPRELYNKLYDLHLFNEHGPEKYVEYFPFNYTRFTKELTDSVLFYLKSKGFNEEFDPNYYILLEF